MSTGFIILLIAYLILLAENLILLWYLQKKILGNGLKEDMTKTRYINEMTGEVFCEIDDDANYQQEKARPTMIAKIKRYIKERRERKLRKELLLAVGTHSTTHAIQAWVEFILYGKTTKELLLSAGEDERVKSWIELLNTPSSQPDSPSEKE